MHSRYTITVANNLPHRYRRHDAVLDDLPRETLDQIASVGSEELLKVHLVVGSHLRNGMFALKLQRPR